MWSVGCIFAEMITRQILFKGTETEDQLRIIIDTLGYPDKDSEFLITESSVEEAVAEIQFSKGKDLSELLAPYSPNPLAVDLIKKMLHFNP